MTTYRIAELGRATGFTPATLRYYEEIGLLSPTPRSEAGYRLYDDRAAERLSFVARAKRLGCTLDEIRDLLVAWDGGECGPVQERLGALIEVKIAESHAAVTELVALTAQLRRAADVLGRHRPEGPCDASCACLATDETEDSAVRAIECSLEPGSVAGRLAVWADLLASGSRPRAIVGGLRVELHDVDIERVAALAQAEHACCRFMAFAVTIDDRGVGLEVRAPADAMSVLYGMFGVPVGSGEPNVSR